MGNGAQSWRWVGAAVLGTAHRRAGLPCQDRFVCRAMPDGALLIVVADGAGSAAYAEEGAALAVQHLADHLTVALTQGVSHRIQAWQTVIRQAFAAAQGAIADQATQSSRATREYATTTTLLVATEQWTIGAAIGDGALVVQGQYGGLISLCPPQRGEYANTTYFLTQPDMLSRLTIAILPQPVSAVAVLTDGLLPLALNLAHNQPFAPFFQPLFAFVETSTDQTAAQTQLAEFLDSPRVNARTDDDKTLVLARRV